MNKINSKWTMVLVVALVGVVTVVQIGKAQLQKSNLEQLTDFANAVGGDQSAFLAGLDYLGGQFGEMFGASGTRFPNGITLGPNGGAINELKSSTCNLSTTQLPLEATSTDVFYCAVTGVASGDQVYVSLPSANYNESVFGGFAVNYAVASGTAGYIEVGIQNLTGSATSTFSAVTTSVQVLYIDN